MASRFLLTPENAAEAGRFVVLAFADELAAFKLRDLLGELEEAGLLEIGDAVVATRNARGKVRLHQSLPLLEAGTAIGSFSGMLLGSLVLSPLFGSIAGAAVGALTSSLVDAGIDDTFMKNLALTLGPGTSALFLVVRKTKPEELLERLSPFAGECRVLQTTLTAANEARLRQVMEGGKIALASPAFSENNPAKTL